MVFLHDEPLAGRNMKKVSDCLLDQTSKGCIDVGKITASRASRFRAADTDLKIWESFDACIWYDMIQPNFLRKFLRGRTLEGKV